MNLAPTTTQIAMIAAVLLLVLILVFKDRVAEIVFGPANLTIFKPEDEQAARGAAEEQLRKEASSVPLAVKPDLAKIATLFWLANDLMSITDMMHHGAGPDRVLDGVNHAARHLRDLGFDGGSFPIRHLAFATDVLQSISGVTNSRVIEPIYKAVAQDILSVKWYISALAQHEQPGFQNPGAL